MPQRKLLEQNRKWSRARLEEDSDYFARLARQQRPSFLWIGCADSRVPANEITGLAPGEVFVHRNVANLVVQTDLNMLSVVQFAVEVLEVKEVIVCGHYGCGGVTAAVDGVNHGLIDNWIRSIGDLAEEHRGELEGMEEKVRLDRLCELNVLAQTRNLRRTTVIENAWARGVDVRVHSWIYRLTDGILTDLALAKEEGQGA